MDAEVAGVVASAINQSGFSTAHELSPHEIHPRRRDDASVVLEPALTIENRHFKPRVVGSVARGPNNCFDLARRQIHSERWCRLHPGWWQAMRRVGYGVETVFLCPFVDPV